MRSSAERWQMEIGAWGCYRLVCMKWLLLLYWYFCTSGHLSKSKWNTPLSNFCAAPHPPTKSLKQMFIAYVLCVICWNLMRKLPYKRDNCKLDCSEKSVHVRRRGQSTELSALEVAASWLSVKVPVRMAMSWMGNGPNDLSCPVPVYQWVWEAELAPEGMWRRWRGRASMTWNAMGGYCALLLSTQSLLEVPLPLLPWPFPKSKVTFWS